MVGKRGYTKAKCILTTMKKPPEGGFFILCSFVLNLR